MRGHLVDPSRGALTCLGASLLAEHSSLLTGSIASEGLGWVSATEAPSVRAGSPQLAPCSPGELGTFASQCFHSFYTFETFREREQTCPSCRAGERLKVTAWGRGQGPRSPENVSKRVPGGAECCSPSVRLLILHPTLPALQQGCQVRDPRTHMGLGA